ncbi:uncharacterized protein LOC121727703 [Aricia agestis]|uniref:uncharacterized protein LOC121727703 n=1 Tax=Aricia agestis TaxID=91739 RepID=UPI001C202128|nr:uncharacterized protein LOC121727703 [Aricia agestis]
MSSEFMLEGTLLRVLQLSRILGAAPLDFKGDGRIVTARVSYPWYIYSCVIVCVCHVLSVLLNYLFQAKNSEKNENESQLFVLLMVVQYVLLALRVYLSSFTSYRRMKSLTVQMNTLQTVFKEFNKKSVAANRQNKVIILVLLFILIFFIVRIVCTVEQMIVVYSTGYIIANDILTYSMLTMLVLQEVKVVLINVKVAEALHVLKMHLKLLLRDNRPIPQADIRRVGSSYIKLYEVVSESNRYEGGVILLMFASIVVSLVSAAFVFADDLNDLEKSHLSFDTVAIAVPAIAGVHRIIIFVRSCHQVHKEVTGLTMSVSELLYRTSLGCAAPVELQALIHQLELTRPVFSVLGVFTVTQSTLTTILSAWVSYTLILIQVRPASSH